MKTPEKPTWWKPITLLAYKCLRLQIYVIRCHTLYSTMHSTKYHVKITREAGEIALCNHKDLSSESPDTGKGWVWRCTSSVRISWAKTSWISLICQSSVPMRVHLKSTRWGVTEENTDRDLWPHRHTYLKETPYTASQLYVCIHTRWKVAHLHRALTMNGAYRGQAREGLGD